MSQPQQIRFATTADGVTLAYVVSGSGPPLVKAWWPRLDALFEIQRRLEAHRKQAGFAPQVRIGINAGEITRHQGASVVSRYTRRNGWPPRPEPPRSW